MKNEKIDTSFWDSCRGLIRSSKGGWKVGKAVYCHGYDMIEDFMGHVSYFQVLVLNATGRLVDRQVADWLEAIFIGLSWPDSRIWCNQIGALAGSARTSVVAATTAGILAADSRNYAQRTLVEGCNFIRTTFTEIEQGACLEELIVQRVEQTGGVPKIIGYARPIVKGDERISAMKRVAEELELSDGEHLRLAYRIEKILHERYDETMNLTGYMAAFFSDLDFSGEEAYRICSIWVNSGVTACFVDTAARPAGSFLPLRCTDIDYQGPAPRAVPD